MSLSSPLTISLAIWGVVVIIYLALLFVGSFVGMREEDTIYLSAGESKLQAEQQVIQNRIKKLEPFKLAFGWGSLAMTLVVAGIWLVGVVRQFMQ